MDSKPWKEGVRQALSRAATDRSVTRIAEELQIDRQKLYDFLSKGYLNADNVRQLEDWLKKNGYLADANEDRYAAALGLSNMGRPVDRASEWLRSVYIMLTAADEKLSSKARVLRASLTYLLDEVVPEIERQAAEEEAKGKR